MFKLFKKYLKPFGGLVIAAILFTFLQVVAELQLPDIMARIVDTGIYNKDLNYVIVRGLEMLAWAIGSVVCVVIAALCAARAAMGFGRDVRAAIFSQVQSYSLAEFETFGASTLITRNTNDVQQVERFLQMLITMAVMTPVMFIGAVVIVALLLKIGMPLLRSLQSRIDAVNRVMREELQGVRAIRAYNKEDFERKRFGKVNRDLADTYIKVGRLMGAVMPLLMFIVNLTIVALYYFGAGQINVGTLTAGEIMALVQYVTLILMSLMMISMIFAILPRTLAATERINAVLSTESTIEDVVVPASLPETAEDGALRTLGADIPEETTVQPAQKRSVPILKMDHVSFRYPESKKDALSDLTFEVAPNTITALIGPTGSGKSSLINLIMRMYDASAGTIYFDGVAIMDIPLSVLRTRVSYTPQKSFLFTGTVADNLRFADPDASDEALWQVLSIAQATEFITPEAGGLDFEIAQGGGNLSGGQRQALSLLMATLKRPELLLLDEHTAALDPKTAAKVLEISNKIVQENHLTTLMITHNMRDAIRYGNRLIMMNEGHVIYDVRGEEKTKLEVSDLLQRFEQAGGEANDRMILS